MTGKNWSKLGSASVNPKVKNYQGKSAILSQKSERESLIKKSTRAKPRPHKCSNSTKNLHCEGPEVTEASDLKVKVSECRRKVEEDLWEEGTRLCSLQEVTVKTPSGVVTAGHFGDAVTPNADSSEPNVRLYKKNVSKYTFKSQLPVSKISPSAVKSTSPDHAHIVSPPPLICDCNVDEQAPLVTLKTLPKIIVKDSANFAKFRHDVGDDERRLCSHVPSSTARKRSEGLPFRTSTDALVLPRDSRTGFSNSHANRIISSHALFSYAEPSIKNTLSKSRLSTITESLTSKRLSKILSKNPVVRVVSADDCDESTKMIERHILTRIIYRAEGVLHDEKITPGNSAAKSKILPIGKVRNTRTAVQKF